MTEARAPASGEPGESAEEALENLREALELYFEDV